MVSLPRDGNFKAYCQAAAKNYLSFGKFPVFFGLTWTAYFHFGGKTKHKDKNVVSAYLSMLMRFRTRNPFSLPAGAHCLFCMPSFCFCTTLATANIPGFYTILCASGTIGSSYYPRCQAVKSTPSDLTVPTSDFPTGVPGKS